MINYDLSVQLGPIDAFHLDKLRRWRNDHRIWQWCRQNDLISASNQSKWLEKISDDDTIRMYTIWSKNVTDLVGVCGLTSIDQVNQRAEFSLYTGPEFHKLGYGKDALICLFKYGFEELNLNLIWGETFEGNPALKLFNNLGMKTDGVRRQFYFKGGKFIDATIVSITREEWICQTCSPYILEASSSQAV